jgi:hypothetical protein
MPSSYRRYAVDGDTDKKRDLWGDWSDVMASVANYLHEFGWEPGAPVLADAKLDPDPNFQIDPRNLELNDTIDGLNARGVKIDSTLAGNTPVVLISAEAQDGPAYRVGFKNFYVITRYNHSARYAMAVNDLAQAIAQRVNPGAPQTTTASQQQPGAPAGGPVSAAPVTGSTAGSAATAPGTTSATASPGASAAAPAGSPAAPRTSLASGKQP